MERKMILLIFVILKYSLIETDLKEETYFVLKSKKICYLWKN